jgi:hypothetical protein
MRKLVTIRTIEAIEPIQGADAIEVAVIGGWKVVTKKGEFAVNDPCVYFEIDSFLPERDPRYSFLMKSVREFEGERGHRLRTIKLRGQISQGLALPVSAFPDIDPANEDIAETIGVKKWEPVLSAQLAGQAKGFFPSFIRKTDQERCQNLKAEIFGYEDSLHPIDVSLIPMEAREAMIRRGELTMMYGEWMKVVKAKASPNDRYEITIKLDGSSCTIYHNNGEFGVCSRNLELKIEENPDNAMVRMLTPELRARLSELGRNYDVYDIDNGCYLGSHERRDFVSAAGLQHVPIICNNVLLDDLEINDIKDLLEYAEGPSLNHPVREGVVFKRMDGGFSFKAISNSFLMKEKD